MKDWLKEQYLDTYKMLTEYGNFCKQNLEKQGYTVLTLDSSAGVFNYKTVDSDNNVNIKTIKITAKAKAVSLGDFPAKPELEFAWKSSISDKEHQILFLYIPICPSGLFGGLNNSAPYSTFFDVITVPEKITEIEF